MKMTELVKMQEAYGYLYLIENNLRMYIEEQMEKEYGSNWFYTSSRKILKRPPSKPFNHLLFHEYTRVYFRTYPVFDHLPEEFFQHLQLLYPLRNKIAHCKCITDDEFSALGRTEAVLNKILGKTYTF